MLLHCILMVTTTSDLSNNADKELLSKDHAVDAIRTWKINNQLWNIQASKLFNRICCSIINMTTKYYFHIQSHEQYEKLIYDKEIKHTCSCLLQNNLLCVSKCCLK